MNPLLRLACLLTLLAQSARAEPPAPIHAVELSAPRDFGIVMGAVLDLEIRVAVEAGYRLETARLPQTGSALDDYLEVRGVSWSAHDEGAATVYRIRLSVQVFKGVRTAETLELPVLPLHIRRGGDVREIHAPAWRYTLSPIIPPDLQDDRVTLAGDLPPPPLSDGRPWALPMYGAALAGLGLYAAHRLGWPPFRRHHRPFARALKALRALRRAPAGREAAREALRILHAALDQTAGHALFPYQLAGFLAERPEYAPLGAELDAFFACSNRVFFGPGAEAPDTDFPIPRLEDLCLALARADARPTRLRTHRDPP